MRCFAHLGSSYACFDNNVVLRHLQQAILFTFKVHMKLFVMFRILLSAKAIFLLPKTYFVVSGR